MRGLAAPGSVLAPGDEAVIFNQFTGIPAAVYILQNIAIFAETVTMIIMYLRFLGRTPYPINRKSRGIYIKKNLFE